MPAARYAATQAVLALLVDGARLLVCGGSLGGLGGPAGVDVAGDYGFGSS